MIRTIEPQALPLAERQAREELANGATVDAATAARMAQAREAARRDCAIPAWGYLLVATLFLAGVLIGKWFPWGFGVAP